MRNNIRGCITLAILLLMTAGCVTSGKQKYPLPSLVGGEVHFPVLEVTDVPLSSVLRYIQVEANKMLPDGAKLSVVVHIIDEGRELLFPVCDVITLTEGGDNSASRLTFYMEDAGLTEILSEISSRTGMKYMFVKNRIDVKHPAFVSRAEVDQKFNGKSR